MLQMGVVCGESDFKSLPTGVYELQGEPAIVINGVPDVSTNFGTNIHSNAVNDAEPLETTGCGEWLEGREVQKFFGGQSYSGIITMFDKESGWYRVDYEDGDYEDLYWHELEQVLVPLDVTIPLKTLATKLVKKIEKSAYNSRSQAREISCTLKKVKKIKEHEEADRGSSDGVEVIKAVDRDT